MLESHEMRTVATQTATDCDRLAILGGKRWCFASSSLQSNACRRGGMGLQSLTICFLDI